MLGTYFALSVIAGLLTGILYELIQIRDVLKRILIIVNLNRQDIPDTMPIDTYNQQIEEYNRHVDSYNENS